MLVPIDLPPGLVRVGTEYQSKGRYYDSNLWRWYDKTSGPVGGWAALATGASGIVRDLHPWVDLSGVARIALASQSTVYTCSTAGTLTNITPAAFTAAAAGSAWAIDSAGQQVFLVNDDDGTVYTFVPGDTEAAALTNAPTASALVVTDEDILMLLGSAGNPRLLQWSDVRAYTSWTPSTTNFTRDLPIQTSGVLMSGKKVRGGTLVWTSVGLHFARFLGRPSVYGVEEIGDNCGLIARGAAVSLDDEAFWMSQNGFFTYAGGVGQIPCSIHEDVFGVAADPTRGINRTHAHKVRAGHTPQFNEIWWHFPQGAATENNKAAVYNYRERTWAYHDIARSGATEPEGDFLYPIMADTSGNIWNHESGTTRTGAGNIFARSGPTELGDGSRVACVNQVFPDEGNAGDVVTYFYTRFLPNQTESTWGPYSGANPIPVRFSGRQVAVEHRLSSGEGKVGTFRVDIKVGGRR